MREQITALYEQLKKESLVRAGYYDEPMSAHTSFKIGGPADLMVIPRDLDAIASILRLCKEYEVPFTLLGNGSNMLVSDKGIRGLTLHTAEMGEKIEQVGKKEFMAPCGAQLSRLSLAARDAGLSGLEFAYGIPGTVGGAVMMNAGAYGGEIADVCRSTECVLPSGEVVRLMGKEQEFGYRKSFFAKEHAVILRSWFLLELGEMSEIRAKMEKNLAARKEKQPLEMPSAGSAFKRPEGHFAGALIEESGLRGFSIGGAQVSEKHCGFVVNTGEATCADIVALLQEIEKRVYENSGVRLEREIRVIGEE